MNLSSDVGGLPQISSEVWVSRVDCEPGCEWEEEWDENDPENSRSDDVKSSLNNSFWLIGC